MPRSHLPYRPCVGITLFNKDGLVFVGERIDTPGAWQMPQGGIDEGEELLAAAHRELKEEVGTDQVELLKIADDKIRYDVPADVSVRHWAGEFRGQEQSWVAMRFMGEDSDICIDCHEPPEFNKWQWVKLEDTVDLIVPFKRDVYKKVISFFKDVA